MALLLNRKYGSRLECLYYILISCYKKYGTNTTFKLGDLKFDEEDVDNVHSYCQLLNERLGRKYCPYLKNPLNASKCYATQSVKSDSTKSKAVSDVGSSLEALGFMKRTGKTIKITSKGEQWANSVFETEEWKRLALEGVLSYGVAVGFLHKIKKLSDEFTYSGIYLGYPRTEEEVIYVDNEGNEINVSLSTDSKNDTNTRTISKIIGWCVSVGLIEPLTNNIIESPLAHIKFRDFVNEDKLKVRNFKKTSLCKLLFNDNLYIENPLSYKHLHKNVGSLRERGGEELREVTLKYVNQILNRRFVFVYILNKFKLDGKSLNLDKLIEVMNMHKEEFFSDNSDPYLIMESECEIADIAGIPFEMEGNNLLPLTVLNEDVLLEEVPDYVLKLAKDIFNRMEE